VYLRRPEKEIGEDGSAGFGISIFRRFFARVKEDSRIFKKIILSLKRTVHDTKVCRALPEISRVSCIFHRARGRFGIISRITDQFADRNDPRVDSASKPEAS